MELSFIDLSVYRYLITSVNILKINFLLVFLSVDKYLTIILIFMVVGIPISFVSPTTGEFRDQPLILLFYGSIAGIIVIVVYSGYKERKDRRKANARRRSKK